MSSLPRLAMGREGLTGLHLGLNMPACLGQVREDKRKGIYIAGVTEAYVTNEAELLAVMAEGQKNR